MESTTVLGSQYFGLASSEPSKGEEYNGSRI